ncbi:MAG: response regulator transcription factor [Saprospirales bacterium]|nr:response regulator transcription factor [Saprospirales bacterium]
MMNLIIVDDKPAQAEGIRIQLDPVKARFHVLDTVYDFNQVKRKMGDYRSAGTPVHTILMDISDGIEFEKGITVAQEVTNLYPDIKIIAMTDYNSPVVYQKVRLSDLAGYLRKGNLPQKLLRALEHLEQGEAFWDVPADWNRFSNAPDKLFFQEFNRDRKKRWSKLTQSMQQEIRSKPDVDPAKPWQAAIDTSGEEFRLFKIDCSLRLEAGLTSAEWEIFKMIALGVSKRDIVEEIPCTSNAFDVHVSNIRHKIFAEEEVDNWGARFVIEALRMRIPDVIEGLQRELDVFIQDNR